MLGRKPPSLNALYADTSEPSTASGCSTHRSAERPSIDPSRTRIESSPDIDTGEITYTYLPSVQLNRLGSLIRERRTVTSATVS